MGWMIIRVSVAPTSMSREDSEIYIGKKLDGTLITIFEYLEKVSQLDYPPVVFCPKCADNGEKQPLTFLAEEYRFIHKNIRRDCYQDHRTHDPDHPLTQQTVYRDFHNSRRFDYPDIEYSLDNQTNQSRLRYDIGAKLPHNPNLEGVVVEVQHRSGRFSSRLYRGLKTAHHRNYGVYVIFTPSASQQQWFSRRLERMKSDSVTVGSYNDDTVDLGTMIRPDDDLSVFKTKTRKNWDLSIADYYSS